MHISNFVYVFISKLKGACMEMRPRF